MKTKNVSWLPLLVLLSVSLFSYSGDEDEEVAGSSELVGQ